MFIARPFYFLQLQLQARVVRAGGTPRNLWQGVLIRSPNPDPLSDQNEICLVSHPFPDVSSNIHNPFQTWPYVQIDRNQLPLLRLERQQKDLVNIFLNSQNTLSFYLFGIETINTFIHSRSSLENHTRFQIKMGEVYIPFFDRKGAKIMPHGAAHTNMVSLEGTPI